MKYIEVKRKLERYRELAQQLRILSEHLDNSILYIKPRMVNMSVKQSADIHELNAVESTADKFGKINEEYYKVQDELLILEYDFVRMIKVLSDEGADLIKARYRDNIPVWQMAREKYLSESYLSVKINRYIHIISQKMKMIR